MPIDPNEVTVASEACRLMGEAFQRLDSAIIVHHRMLQPTDANFSIGVFPSVWMPDEDSYEMGHQPTHEPTLSATQLGIQILTKDSDRVRGLSLHTVIAKRVRRVLYRDNVLRLGLEALAVTASGETESFRRGRLVSHRYLSNEIGNNTLAYLSVLDYSLETEMR